MTPVQPIVKFDGEYRWLSNFYERPVRVGNLTFANNEAAFQGAKYKAAKCDQTEQYRYLEKMVQADAQTAKNMGRRIPLDLDKWESIKVTCMREVVKAKFDQHADLQMKLIETGAALLVEGNHWGDKFWGRCEGKGLNVLGSILMELRGYYFWKEYQSIW
ncbi:hypothetical protein KNV00_gp062 [Streptomyces phage Bmoc]|uniref:NADAR domain-containing protein n=1 Tax=Streptomyces phage Bmoc TaxID=2725629 RepID=A0A6M3SYS7_9CAUD|nr:hypothetical protein KNV00_gp062 [Streptomyces phage Bmoc]QJD50957.1 hypothetical protein SEA_BMOC_249 [Streptomyces phage Bmoc]